MLNRYSKNIEKLNQLTEVALSKREVFFQQFLIVSSALLGIVVSLHTTNSPFLCIRLVYVAALVLLSLGVLANLIAVFDFLQIRIQARKAYHDELSTAVRTDREVGLVTAGWKKRTLFCANASLILFVGGLLLLASYSILTTLL